MLFQFFQPVTVSPSVAVAKASDHLCQWAYRVGMMNILKRKRHSQKAN